MNENFYHMIVSWMGSEGQEWLDDLPRKVREYESRWSIRVDQPFDLSYNYVAPAFRSDGKQAVLKIGFPGDREFLSQAAALLEFDGQGTVSLLECDLQNAVLLMERVIPGTTLDLTADDEQETRIAARVAKMLWRPVPADHNFILLEDWGQGFDKHRTQFNGGSGPIPVDIFNLGESLFRQMLETTESPMLLHGDFHHWNILRSADGTWIAIDPKGVIGDPVYDTSVFLYNPFGRLLERPELDELLKKRVEIFSSELGFEQERIVQWGIAQAVLSAVWSIEEHSENWRYTIGIAELLSRFLS